MGELEVIYGGAKHAGEEAYKFMEEMVLERQYRPGFNGVVDEATRIRKMLSEAVKPPLMELRECVRQKPPFNRTGRGGYYRGGGRGYEPLQVKPPEEQTRNSGYPLPCGALKEHLLDFDPIWRSYCSRTICTEHFRYPCFDIDDFPGPSTASRITPLPPSLDFNCKDGLPWELANRAILEYNAWNEFQYKVLKIEKVNFKTCFRSYLYWMTVKVLNLTLATSIETFQIHAYTMGSRKYINSCRHKQEIEAYAKDHKKGPRALITAAKAYTPTADNVIGCTEEDKRMSTYEQPSQTVEAPVTEGEKKRKKKSAETEDSAVVATDVTEPEDMEKKKKKKQHAETEDSAVVATDVAEPEDTGKKEEEKKKKKKKKKHADDEVEPVVVEQTKKKKRKHVDADKDETTDKKKEKKKRSK